MPRGFLKLIFGILVLSTISLLAYSQQFRPNTKLLLETRTSPQLTLLLNRSKSRVSTKFQPGMQRLKVQWDDQITWDQYYQKAKARHPEHPVILIVVESLRSDVLETNVVMPNLYQLKNESIFMKAYAASNSTDHSWPSIFSSQYPMRSDYRYYYPRRSIYPTITIYDVLKQFGYQTAIFSAQNEQWCGMANAFNRASLDVFFSAENAGNDHQYIANEDVGFAAFVKKFKLAGKLDDSTVAQKAMDWITKIHNHHFFVGINFQRTHFPYTWPDSFKPPFTHGEPQKWFYPKDQTANMLGRYQNALKYTDEQIGKILQFLKEQNLYEQSLIIITGDHGESFHEHGSTCHSNNLYNETVLTPVVIKFPSGQTRVNPYKTPELIDLAPSILDLLNLPPHASFQGQSLFTQYPSEKPIFITVNSPIAKEDAIVFHHWKLIKNHRDNLIQLFDLQNDPLERENLAKTNSHQTSQLLYLLMAWRNEQLNYYSNLSKQTQLYSPKYSIE